jgi:large subunit ribosomal protein L29
MYIDEIRDMSDDDLLDLYDDMKINLFNMRQQMVTGELKDTSAVKKARRDIARALTVLRERELAEQIAAASAEAADE